MIKKIVIFLCMFLSFEIGLQIFSLIAKNSLIGFGKKSENIQFQESTYKIMTLGESTTAWGGEFYYPTILEKILNEKYPKKFNVYNEGEASINSSIILSRLPGLITKIKPNAVVLMIGINDYWSLPDEQLSKSRKVIHFLSKYLKTFKLIEIGFVNLQPVKEAKVHVTSKDKCMAMHTFNTILPDNLNRKSLEELKKISNTLELSEVKKRFIKAIRESNNIEVARFAANVIEGTFGLLANDKVFEAVGEVCKEGLRFSPEDSGCGEYYARYLFRSGQIDEAQYVLEKVVKKNPPALHSYLLLGAIYKDNKKYELSFQTFENGIKNINVKGYCEYSFYLQQDQLNLLLDEMNDPVRANHVVEKMLTENVIPGRYNQLLNIKNKIRKRLNLPIES